MTNENTTKSAESEAAVIAAIEALVDAIEKARLAAFHVDEDSDWLRNSLIAGIVTFIVAVAMITIL